MKKILTIFITAAIALMTADAAASRCTGNNLITAHDGTTHGCRCSRDADEFHPTGGIVLTSFPNSSRCSTRQDFLWMGSAWRTRGTRSDGISESMCRGYDHRNFNSSTMEPVAQGACWTFRCRDGLAFPTVTSEGNTTVDRTQCVQCNQYGQTIQGGVCWTIDCRVANPAQCADGGCVIWQGMCMPVCASSMVGQDWTDPTVVRIRAAQ